MSHVSFAAWGSVDVEKLERMQRRVYIRHVREELAKHHLALECGGSKQRPYYALYRMVNGIAEGGALLSYNGKKALSVVLTKALEIIKEQETKKPENWPGAAA